MARCGASEGYRGFPRKLRRSFQCVMFVATFVMVLVATSTPSASQDLHVAKDSGIELEDLEEWRTVRVSPRSGIGEELGLKHFTIGNGSHPTSDYVFYGDSYTGHLKYGLGRVAIWRNISFHLSFRPACGLRPPEVSNKNCGRAYDEFWRMVDALPSKKNIVVGNRMDFHTKEELKDYMTTLYDMVRAKGHRLTVIGNPPFPLKWKSIADYYVCADASLSKVGKLLSGVTGRKSQGAQHCLDDLEEGFMIQENFWQDAVLMQMSRKIGDTLRFLDWKPTLCHKTMNDKDELWFRCKYPTSRVGVVYDIGFKPDARHFTIVGSFNVARVLDEFLFPGLSSRHRK